MATANTKAVGYAPASQALDGASARSPLRRARPQLENPTGLIGFYGYENDVVSAGDPTKPQMVPT